MGYTYIIDEQPLDEITPQMLIVKIIREKAQNFWGANVNVAILQPTLTNHLSQK